MAALFTDHLANVSRRPRAGRPIWAYVHAGLVGLGEALARQRGDAPVDEELASLDDHMLRDIGLTRGDIEWAVRFGRP